MHLIRSANECCTRVLLRLHFYVVFSFLLVSLFGQLMEVHPGGQTSLNPLCVNNSTSCSFQQSNASNLPDSACMMIYHSFNDSVCYNSNFQGTPDVYEFFGKMTLHAYLSQKWYTSFNVSFTHIKWTNVHMRFIENRVKDASLCREFQIDPQASGNITNIFFDCLWETNYETKFYHFDYMAIGPSGESFVYKYIFNVPEARRIDLTRVNVTEWETFLVVDVSAAPKTLILRLQVAPPSLNITGYKVHIVYLDPPPLELQSLFGWFDYTWVNLTIVANQKVEILRTLGLEKPWPVLNRTLPANENDTELKFEFATKLKFGKYKFEVIPVHPLCARMLCQKSSTPEILIVEMTEPKLLTGIVVTCLCIPILLLTYFMWKRKCETEKPCPEPPGPPKFLLMYKPASIQHLRKMMELHKYFTKVCGIHSMMDQFMIPQTISRDPISWYTLAFKEADFVGIFASPETSAAEREAVLSYNAYINTEVIAHNHLKTYLCSPGARCKFFSIILPGTQWQTLPPQAQALKRYTLPRDLDPLLVLIGVTPQCDHGEGFNEALQAAMVPESPTVLSMPVPPVRPTTVAVCGMEDLDPREGGSRTRDPQEESQSLCCNTHSGSDMDLVSTQSRPYVSDMSTASSMDHLSLLGESN
uniref:Leishmanolysin-like peptidase n=1 Tax=Lygus hesperus TaxID=30085 RepID=A0A0A9Y9J5_LYGHE